MGAGIGGRWRLSWALPERYLGGQLEPSAANKSLGEH